MRKWFDKDRNQWLIVAGIFIVIPALLMGTSVLLSYFGLIGGGFEKVRVEEKRFERSAGMTVNQLLPKTFEYKRGGNLEQASATRVYERFEVLEKSPLLTPEWQKSFAGALGELKSDYQYAVEAAGADFAAPKAEAEFLLQIAKYGSPETAREQCDNLTAFFKSRATEFQTSSSDTPEKNSCSVLAEKRGGDGKPTGGVLKIETRYDWLYLVLSKSENKTRYVALEAVNLISKQLD